MDMSAFKNLRITRLPFGRERDILHEMKNNDGAVHIRIEC